MFHRLFVAQIEIPCYTGLRIDVELHSNVWKRVFLCYDGGVVGHES